MQGKGRGLAGDPTRLVKEAGGRCHKGRERKGMEGKGREGKGSGSGSGMSGYATSEGKGSVIGRCGWEWSQGH